MRFYQLFFVCSALLAPIVSLAQPNLSSQQMVEQLKAPPRTGATRSLRNLEVEPVVQPSLSMQVQFDFNSARVGLESQDVLRNLAHALISPELQTANFNIEGHTDAKGKADYNLRLSQARADAVRDFLVQNAVDSRRLTPIGKGSTELANGSDPFAAENRRVRIVNLIN